MHSSANFWHHGGEDMFYFLGVLIVASGTILLLGLASRPSPPAQTPRSEHEDEF